MDSALLENYLEDVRSSFRDYKSLAEKAFAQISHEEFFHTLDADANSIAVIIKHMSGNMLSRWTDFLTSDGEKPFRHRDGEFALTAEEAISQETLMQQWERGWACLFAALEPLTPEDLRHKVLIRGEPHTVIEALNRQLTHYAYHIGQIVLLAKHMRSENWKSLSVPKNKSAIFNQAMQAKQATGIDTSRQTMSRLAPDSSLYSEDKKS